ncbi:MAG: hypothetical protein HQ485_12365 [Acidobacteria bacterium]|jgi:hypothetical protein|nr:hypothetical protein [Acidobacteriota bacterium]
MTIVPLLLLTLVAAPAPEMMRQGVPAPSQRLVRVSVVTDDGGDPDELADRRQSVEDLVRSFGSKSKKKVLTIVEEPNSADVVLDVVGRGVTTPRFVMGLPSRSGQPGGAPRPVRTALLQVRFVQGEEAIMIANKNKPSLSPRGWKSAADDIADQIRKLLASR